MAELQSALVLFRLHDCVVEMGVDASIAVLTIVEHVSGCDTVVVEMFALHTDYQSST